MAAALGLNPFVDLFRIPAVRGIGQSTVGGLESQCIGEVLNPSLGWPVVGGAGGSSCVVPGSCPRLEPFPYLEVPPDCIALGMAVGGYLRDVEARGKHQIPFRVPGHFPTDHGRKATR